MAVLAALTLAFAALTFAFLASFAALVAFVWRGLLRCFSLACPLACSAVGTMAGHKAGGALVGESFWTLTFYGVAPPVLVSRAYGNTFLVDHSAVLVIVSATICSVSAVGITF